MGGWPTLSHGIPDLGLPHPFDCAQGRPFPRFLREGGSSQPANSNGWATRRQA